MFRRLRPFFAVIVPAILVLVLAFVLLCYLNRWDEFVVITLIPMWAWAAVATLVSVIAWLALKSRFALLTFALWLIAGIALSDETAGLLREFHAAVTGSRPAPAIKAEEPIAEHLRVVTLNCDDGKAEATGDLKGLKPDIVLLQEAPDRAASSVPSNAPSLHGDASANPSPIRPPGASWPRWSARVAKGSTWSMSTCREPRPALISGRRTVGGS